MKRLLTILAIAIISINGFSQSIVGRSNSSYTVMDSRFMAQYNLFVPRYADTTAANLQKGIDTLGAVIFCYNTMTLWVRSQSPKVWVEVGSGGGGGGTWGSITGTLSDQTDLQSALDLKAPLASPTFTGTVTMPTPFTLGATSVTSTGTQLNYLNAATGTTGTTTTNIVYSTSPLFTTPRLASTSTTGYVWTATDASGNGSFQAAPSGGNLIVEPLGTGTHVLIPENDSLKHRTVIGGTNITVDTVVSTRELRIATQTLVAGSAGADFAITTTPTTHTIDIPSMASGSVTRGLITNTTQTIPGTKTWSGAGVFTSAIQTSTSSSSANFWANGTSIIGNLSTTAGYIVRSATGTNARLSSLGTTATTLTANYNGAVYVMGQMTSTEATSGTSPLNAGMLLRSQNITNGAGSTTDATTLYIEGAPGGTASITNPVSAMWINSGDLRLGEEGVSLSRIKMAGNTSGEVILTPAAAAGTPTFTFGTTTGMLAGTLTNTATLDFDLTAVNYQDLTITVTDAADGDVVSIGVPNGAAVADVTYFGWVSGTNTVTIRCSRVGGGGAANPASGTFRASVTKY